MELAARLEGIVGTGHVRTAGGCDAYAVDGIRPEIVVSPASVEEVSAVLALCSEAGAAVVPWGGGTGMGLGAIPSRAQVVLLLTRLARILDHEPADMTSTVEAGCVLREYQTALGRHGQFLALDPPRADRATIGGILATNASGPRRQRYGTARDLLIGCRIVHADGTLTKAGAKVVKNVTGYDLNKLYIGSLGTLGVIVEASFRLYPLPACERTWVGEFPTPRAAGEAVARILDSSLVATAVELLSGAAATAAGRQARVDLETGGTVLAVGVASIPQAVEAQLAQAAAVGGAAGGGPGHILEGESHDTFWTAVRDFAPPDGPAMVLKAGILPSRVAEAVARGEDVARRQGLTLAVVAEAGAGVVRYYLEPGDEGRDGLARLAAAVGPLRDFAREARGSLVVQAAPPEVKAAVEVWGPVGNALPLMRRLKERLDPAGLLNPGRFVGGL